MKPSPRHLRWNGDLILWQGKPRGGRHLARNLPLRGGDLLVVTNGEQTMFKVIGTDEWKTL